MGFLGPQKELGWKNEYLHTPSTFLWWDSSSHFPKSTVKYKQTGRQGHVCGEPVWCRQSYAYSQHELTGWWDLEQVTQMIEVSVF